MILWSQQYNIVSKVFHSFHNGKKVTAVKLSDKDIERARLFLNPSKFETQTLSNFTIIVLYCMFYEKPASKIEMLKLLNSYNKEKISKAMKLKSDVLSYKYLVEQDERKINSLNISPYEAYKMNQISVFGVAKYYTEHPEEVTGRIMKKDITDSTVLVDHFRFSQD